MIPLFLTIGATVAGSLGYVYYMVRNSKAKPKRKSKPQIPEPIKEESRLKLEDFAIA